MSGHPLGSPELREQIARACERATETPTDTVAREVAQEVLDRTGVLLNRHQATLLFDQRDWLAMILSY